MPSREPQGDEREGDGCGGTDSGRVLADRSACNPTGVSARDELKSRTGDEIGVSAVKGIHLGGVGVWGGDDRTSLEAATSLVGLTAGPGVARSVLGISGRGVGGPRGVVIVGALPSLESTAKGEGAKEFNSPLMSERGGTEIMFSLSFSLMIG